MSSNLVKIENAYIEFDENGEIIVKQRDITINDKIKEIIDNEPDEGPFECTICNKSFVKKSYWKRHVLSHDEMFSCTICHKKFAHNHHLTQHMKVHREKEYSCDICGFKVRFKFNLKKHRNIHIPYKDKNGEIKYITLK
jgi:uncharacterized Zn-finger protein